MNKTGGEFPFWGRRALGVFVFLIVWRGDTTFAQERPRVAHVFVALADNAHQGIVPCPRFWEMEMIQNEICIGVPPLG
jgi:hypothetical protein